jgi:hypothetical protein
MSAESASGPPTNGARGAAPVDGAVEFISCSRLGPHGEPADPIP